jgi:hypothetical protein
MRIIIKTKKIYLSLLILTILLSTAWSNVSQVQANTSTPVQITVSPVSISGIISADFLGLSYPISRIATSDTMSSEFLSTDNSIYAKLLENLGSGVFRMNDGNTNYTFWLTTPPAGICKTGNHPITVLSKANVDNLFAIAKLTGWSVIFGVNMGCYTSTTIQMAANEAAYLQKTGGNSLIALELGNEPNGYALLGLRDSAYDPTKYEREFNQYADAINKAVKHVRLAGPSTVVAQSWFTHFLGSGSIDSSTADIHDDLATVHMYSIYKSKSGIDGIYCEPSVCQKIIGMLLSEAQAEATNTQITTYTTIAKQKNFPLRFDEVNSVSIGGMNGVSDRFAATLWGIDTLFMMADSGASGVNFSGGGCHGYSPISYCPAGSSVSADSATSNSQAFKANALYYSMLFFHEATEGNSKPLKVAYDKTLANLGVYAVQAQDNTLRVILVNRDSQNSVSTSINPGSAYSSARMIRLLAPAINSPAENITLAGSSVQDDGSWTYKTDEPVNIVGTKYPVTLPPGSAAIVTFSHS